MMKRKNLVLLFVALFIGVFSFSGCATQKNYNMSYEQVISLLENQSKEMMEMFFNFGAQEKDVNFDTKLNTNQLNLDLSMQSQAKIDYDSKVQDLDLSFVADVKIPESELDFSTSGAVNYSLIGDNIYLKLSKFSLKGPSAKDLAMVNMVVNGFKGQRFKLGMTGMSMSHTFDLYDLYSERLGDIVDNAGKAMINQGSGIYDGIFDEYKGYNAWKYSIDEEKFDEMLHMYVDMMNEFYSGLLAQYSQNLGTQDVDLVDFNEVLSGITYDDLQGYFVIVGKNEVVETMEGAHMVIDGTGIVFNYYYGKDGLCFEAKAEDGQDFMSIVAKRNGRIYNVYANLNSMFNIKGDVKFNKFSKKDGIDADFDLIMAVNVDSEMLADSEGSKEIDMQIPFKGNYKLKNIDNFSLQEPKDAVDLMDMLGNYMGSVDEQLPSENEDLTINN